MFLYTKKHIARWAAESSQELRVLGVHGLRLVDQFLKQRAVMNHGLT
jgi:hypothetical protein